MPRYLAPPYNYHHFSLLLTTPSCPTHHSRKRKRSQQPVPCFLAPWKHH